MTLPIQKLAAIGTSVVISTLTFLVPADSIAQTYPAREVRFVCVNPPGAGADVIVRYFAEKVHRASGVTVIVENKPGAGGKIAMEYVSRSKPDGYTVLVHSAAAVVATTQLLKNSTLGQVDKEFTVAATINRQPYMLVVDAGSPYKTLTDLTAAMRSKGDKASYSSGIPFGTVMGELYKAATNVQAVEVVYRQAADSLNDFASGAVDFGATDPVFSLAQQRAGRLRILGISTAERMKAAPELPTMTEQGASMDLVAWWAAMVPAATPQPVIDQINRWFVDVVSSDETTAFLNKFGGDPLIETPAQGQARLVADVAKWREYIRVAKIKPIE
jgi:tripartite-type tricarboxylate transporter receptor subunit TctC